MKQLLISFLISLLPLLTFGQSDSVNESQCESGGTSDQKCWTIIDYPNSQRYVGFVEAGKPQGEGILYWSNGFINQSGIRDSGNFIKKINWDKTRFPFDNSPSGQATRAYREELERKNEEIERKNAEFERSRPPLQKIVYCVQTVSVETRGTTFPSISIPYCQDACNKTYFDRMCSEVGGSKWRVQASSTKTAPPNSSYFAGMGSCSCVGQEYVLNELKGPLPPVPATVSVPQTDTREAELAKREKALAEREKALLEAENKRLRDELEAERKKKNKS